ncbi:hypothetical protein D6445_23585 [Salmonella enterica subsp. enterica serovar Infantis]|nr:hypothetical protein [Salmonella enterica subsp. enterica serovar Infantis]
MVASFGFIPAYPFFSQAGCGTPLIAQMVKRRTGADAGDEAKFISRLRGKNFAESRFAAALAAVSGRCQSAFAMRSLPLWS